MTVGAWPLLVTYWCPGAAKTKGSMEHLGQGKMRESVKGSSRWRMLMAERARRAYGGQAPYEKAVIVSAIFYLLPPPSVIRKGQEAVDAWLISRGSGDVDKLTRNLLDSLTDSGVIADDAQVIRIDITKCASWGDGAPIGVSVSAYAATVRPSP